MNEKPVHLGQAHKEGGVQQLILPGIVLLVIAGLVLVAAPEVGNFFSKNSPFQY